MAREIKTRPIDRSRLPGSILEAVESYEAENNRIVDDTLEDILEAFLHWEGVIGYTWNILKIFEACLETPPE